MPYHFRFKSREKSPIALQICHESRTLALKHYTPSFHSTTSPVERASQVKQTALYFSPELDIVHIADDKQFWNLSYRAQTETIQSIKALAIGNEIFQNQWTNYSAERLFAFESLVTLVLVIEREVGGDEQELIRANMEGHLIKAQDRLVLQGNCKEWHPPTVKVMTRRAFENHL
jgi:hypothetical protein